VCRRQATAEIAVIVTELAGCGPRCGWTKAEREIEAGS
jgi:hypothetical protein